MRRSKPSPQSDFFPGFTDVTEIGMGSLATVFRAREIGTNRLVALKLLNVRDASPRAIESFERESIALGAVSSHPNIVTLFRSFRAGDGRPVLVLELCAGSIADRMRNGQGLPAPEVVALGIKIAGALETAHRAEILHRDVKPQNILITEFGEPALADFGVAMLQSSTQTTAGLFDFTTLHAAPELLEGGETSAATDVYELASSLYQLVAGRSAFRAYDGESPASVILRILRDPVQPLVNAQVPSSLSDLLIYAMSKDKASRPPTAAEFATELAAIEVEQQWPRTQFLIRDAAGGTTGLPAITRLPSLERRAAPPVQAYAPPAPAQPVAPATVVMPAGPPSGGPPPSGPPLGGPPPRDRFAPPPFPPPAAPVAGDGWSAITVSGTARDHEAVAAAPVPAASPPMREEPVTRERIIVERRVIERLTYDSPPDGPPTSASDAGWSRAALTQSHEVLDAEPEPERALAPEPPTRAEEPSVRSEPASSVIHQPFDQDAVAWAPPPPPTPEIAQPPAGPSRATREVHTAAFSAAAAHAVPIGEPETPSAAVPEPEPGPMPVAPVPVAPVPVAPEPVSSWAPPTVDDRPEPVVAEPGPLPGPASASQPFVPWRGALADPDEPLDAPTGAPSVTPATSFGPDPAPAQQYPIPPAGVADPNPPVDPGTGAVPTWAFRAATQGPPASATGFSDLTLDPMSLRSKVTVRSGASSLVVDDDGLTARSKLRRTTIPWSDVLAFEPRWESAAASGSGGRLVAVTHSGPVDLPATRRAAADLRYMHALLDAYRQRATIMGRR